MPSQVKERIGLQAEEAAFTKIPGASEIAQLPKVLTSKPDNLSSVPSIHKVKGERVNSRKLCSDLYLHTHDR